MKCRLLYVVGQLRAGGLERQLWYLLKSLDRREYPVGLVVWNFRPDQFYAAEMKNLAMRLEGFAGEWSAQRKLAALRSLVNTLRPEVVHSYSFYTNFPAWLATQGTAANPVGSLRSDFVTERKLAGRLLGQLSARWPRFMISNNEAAASSARRGGWFSPGTIRVVRNGLDLALFKDSGRFPTIPTVAAVGSLIPDKRWDRLLQACGILRRRGKQFRLRLVGDGPMRDQLGANVASEGISDCVEFLGQREDVPGILADSTFLAHTADREGCPNVVMEAMASGKPVVATDAGDVPALVEHGKTGYVVRRGEDDDLAQRMTELIESPDLCRNMGRAGRLKAENEFGLDRLVSETLAAYRAAGWTR